MNLDRNIYNETISYMSVKLEYCKEYIFYVHLLAKCKLILTSDVEIAAVSFKDNKYNLYINPEGFSKFSILNRMAILKHEMLHIMNGHCIGLRLKENNDKTNIAYDCAINQLIKKEHLPVVGVTVETIKKMIDNKVNVEYNRESEYYYDLLNKYGNDEKQQSFDDHSKMYESDELFNQDLAKEITKDIIKKSVESTLISNGDLPVNISDVLNLFSRKSEIDWKKEIKKLLGSRKVNKIKKFNRTSRRFQDNPEIKGTTKEYQNDVLCILDASGSVDDSSIIKLLSEIKNVCTQCKSDVTLIQIDTVASEPEKITNKTTVFKREKYGGTVLFPAFEKAIENKIKFNTVIICTDGMLFNKDIKNIIEMCKRGIQIIWLIEKNGNVMDEMKLYNQKVFKIN